MKKMKMKMKKKKKKGKMKEIISYQIGLFIREPSVEIPQHTHYTRGFNLHGCPCIGLLFFC